MNGPFTLTPKGGFDNGQVFVDADGVYHNSNSFTRQRSAAGRLQRRRQLVPRTSRGASSARSARRYTDDTVIRLSPADFSTSSWMPDGTTIAIPIRPYHQVNTRADYTSLYAGDTMSLDRLTLNGALRFDRTTNSVDAITVPRASRSCPTSCPGVDAPAVKNAVVWNAWSPRVGATYALGSKHGRRIAARQLRGVCQPVERDHGRQRLGGELRLRVLPGGRREPQPQHRAGELSAAPVRQEHQPRTNPASGRSTRSPPTSARRGRTRSSSASTTS